MFKFEAEMQKENNSISKQRKTIKFDYDIET